MQPFEYLVTVLAGEVELEGFTTGCAPALNTPFLAVVGSLDKVVDCGPLSERDPGLSTHGDHGGSADGPSVRWYTGVH